MDKMAQNKNTMKRVLAARKNTGMFEELPTTASSLLNLF